MGNLQIIILDFHTLELNFFLDLFELEYWLSNQTL